SSQHSAARFSLAGVIGTMSRRCAVRAHRHARARIIHSGSSRGFAARVLIRAGAIWREVENNGVNSQVYFGLSTGYIHHLIFAGADAPDTGEFDLLEPATAITSRSSADNRKRETPEDARSGPTARAF